MLAGIRRPERGCGGCPCCGGIAVNDLHENESQTVYQRWSHTVTGMLSCQLKLFETQCQVGFKIVEAALSVPGRPEAPPGEQGGAVPQTTSELQRLESLAFECAGKGLA